MAAQLILMKGRSARDDRSWRARATSSLPVPLSPVMSTVEGVSATLAKTSNTPRIAVDPPIMP